MSQRDIPPAAACGGSTVLGSLKISVQEIRAEMGLSRSELAGLVVAHRHGARLSRFRCREQKECSPGVREKCIAYVTRQGHLCWFLTGTMCEGQRQESWSDKLRLCLDCSFMQGLLRPVKAKAHIRVAQRRRVSSSSAARLS